MKVKLQCGKNPNNGYINIDSRPNLVAPILTEDIEFLVGSYGNLDPIIRNEECEEIIFSDPLNSLNPKDLVNIVAHWYGKLQKNGILITYFLDINKIADFILQNKNNDHMTNSYLLGPQDDFNSILDLSTLENAFKAVGFSILSREYPSNVAIKLTLKKV